MALRLWELKQNSHCLFLPHPKWLLFYFSPLSLKAMLEFHNLCRKLRGVIFSKVHQSFVLATNCKSKVLQLLSCNS